MCAGSRARVLLVGWFRSMIPAAMETPYGSQGGFVDSLAQVPYSLANARLKAFVETDPCIRERYDVALLNLAEPLALEDQREEVRPRDADVEAILTANPAIVGFSTYCWNLDAVSQTARRLKAARPGLTILVGGKATEGDPVALLRDLPAVDIAIVGEGELPLRELLLRGCRDLDGVPGLAFRDGDNVTIGGPKNAILDLDIIPSPLLEGIIDPPQHAVMVEWSRGCLNACGYCTWNADKTLRWFSPERIAAEVAWARDHGHRHITVNDSAINYDTERLSSIVDAIREVDPTGEVAFTYNVHHTHIDEEQLAILARLPTHMVLVGIETLWPDGMAEVDRDAVERGRLRAALARIAEAIKPPVVSIVLGLPGDGEARFLDTLDTLMAWTRPDGGRAAPVGCVLVSLLQVYRGSKLWNRRRELGLCFQERGIPYLLEGPGWPPEALARAKAELVRRMASDRETLKAAEAIVLMEASEGADPWLNGRRVSTLLRPWEIGQALAGWTLEHVGLARDTGLEVLLRFAWQGGGAARIRLRRPGGPERLTTEHYAVSLGRGEPPQPPTAARRNLVQVVWASLRRGERRLAGSDRGAARKGPDPSS